MLHSYLVLAFYHSTPLKLSRSYNNNFTIRTFTSPTKPFGPVPIENVGSIVPSGKIVLLYLQGVYNCKSLQVLSYHTVSYCIQLFTTPTLELKVASRDPLLLSLIILPIAIPLKEVKEPAIMILPSGCINEQYTFH
jgi:hypothetical protein